MTDFAHSLEEWTLCEVRDQEDHTAVLWVCAGYYRVWSNGPVLLLPDEWRVVRAEPESWRLPQRSTRRAS